MHHLQRTAKVHQIQFSFLLFREADALCPLSKSKCDNNKNKQTKINLLCNLFELCPLTRPLTHFQQPDCIKETQQL